MYFNYIAIVVGKAGERGGAGGAKYVGPELFRGPEILLRRLVMVRLSRGLGARNV